MVGARPLMPAKHAPAKARGPASTTSFVVTKSSLGYPEFTNEAQQQVGEYLDWGPAAQTLSWRVVAGLSDGIELAWRGGRFSQAMLRLFLGVA
jgi:hypothetical protein